MLIVEHVLEQSDEKYEFRIHPSVCINQYFPRKRSMYMYDMEIGNLPGIVVFL